MGSPPAMLHSAQCIDHSPEAAREAGNAVLATNLAILVVLSFSLRLLGVERILDEQGVDLDLDASWFSRMYDSPDPNAFATGARRNRALVAVSSRGRDDPPGH